MHPFLQRLLARPDVSAGETVVPAEPAQPAPQGAVPELLHEDDVNPAMLLRLFRQAFFTVESAPGGRLRLTTDSGMHMQLTVDTERRLLMFWATYGMSADADRVQKLEFINRVNDRVVFVRFSLLDEKTLYVDHHLPYDGGVTAAAVVGSVRRLGRIAPQAILEFATPGLMA